MEMGKRFLMRGNVLFGAVVLASIAAGFRPGLPSEYDVAALAGLLGILLGLCAIAVYSLIKNGIGPETKLAVNNGTIYACIFAGVSAAIAVESVSAFAHGAFVPAALVFAAALATGSVASLWIYSMEFDDAHAKKPFWEDRSYLTLFAFQGLLPLMALPLMAFLREGRVYPYWITPAIDLAPLGIMGIILFLQFFWATEMDHALMRRNMPRQALAKASLRAA